MLLKLFLRGSAPTPFVRPVCIFSYSLLNKRQLKFWTFRWTCHWMKRINCLRSSSYQLFPERALFLPLRPLSPPTPPHVFTVSNKRRFTYWTFRWTFRSMGRINCLHLSKCRTGPCQLLSMVIGTMTLTLTLNETRRDIFKWHPQCFFVNLCKSADLCCEERKDYWFTFDRPNNEKKCKCRQKKRKIASRKKQ